MSTYSISLDNIIKICDYNSKNSHIISSGLYVGNKNNKTGLIENNLNKSEISTKKVPNNTWVDTVFSPLGDYITAKCIMVRINEDNDSTSPRSCKIYLTNTCNNESPTYIEVIQSGKPIGIGIYLKTGEIIDYSNADLTYSKDDIYGISILLEYTNDFVTDYPVNIVIHPDSVFLCWFSNGKINIPESFFEYSDIGCLLDFNGRQHTLDLHSYFSVDPNWAITYCYNKKINGNQCYLPSAGELDVIISNLDIINDLLERCGCTKIPNCWLWSSTVDKGTIWQPLTWVFGYNTETKYVDGLNVLGYYYALPISTF